MEEKTNCGNAQPVYETSSRQFRWKINNFSKLNVIKLYSDIFCIGGYKWRILLFPIGNNADHLSVYLDAADSEILPSGWTKFVQFSLTVINQIDEHSVTKETQHYFNARESDWGFTSLISLSVLNNPVNGFLVNDTLTVETEIRLREEQDKDELERKKEADAHLYGLPKVVRFRSLKKPTEDEFCLELLMLNTYDDVVESVAQHLGLDDPSKIRLTSHNCYSQQPKPQPIKYRGVDHLSDMLVHYNETSDILYYEILDIPLPELQGLKTLKVAFHHATKDEVVIHTVRLPKQSTVGDVIYDLKTKVELSHPNAEIRLLAIFYHKIYKIFLLNEKIEKINDQYWTLRAEEIPEEEKNLGPHNRIIHVYHFRKDTVQNQMQVQNFGEPFLLAIQEDETLAEVKVRIKKKLRVPDEEFAKWKIAFLSLGLPEYLHDNDIIANWFQRSDVYGAWEQYLGLEHTDNVPKRSYTPNQGASIESQQEPLPEMNPPQKQSTQTEFSSIIIEEQPELETQMDEANVCSQAQAPVTILTETSQQTEQVTPTAEDTQEDAKPLPIPSAPLIVDLLSSHPQKQTVVEREICSSSFSKFDALFADIQNILGGKISKSKTSSSFCSHASSFEEISKARKIFKECLNMELASVIQLGRAPELKNSFSIMLSGNAFPDNMVKFTMKFLANLGQYTGAQQELREVHEKEKSIGEMETTMKQLVFEFMPLRNQAEAVDQEIAELERQLTEKKAKKELLRKSLEDLAGRATSSKQALLDAQEAMWLLKIKKEQAEKMVADLERSWELLKFVNL